ncbi:hypothetical protein [Methanogenium cariaci]|jgi:hypothetical protein|uniref:hypothetical protein n=1 Tax=Methanogenium cariaci TaxID=2197 RepID=UPI000783FCF5|nr:hypothetical protein [Methanogenium cariaci]
MEKRSKPVFIKARLGSELYLNFNQIDFFFAGKLYPQQKEYSVYAAKVPDSEGTVDYIIRDGFVDENEAKTYLQTLLERISTMTDDEYLIDPDHL